jgi:hypothetical protein
MVATMDKVPPWVIVMLAVLGWNEFITILSSPLYLFLTIVLGGGFYFLYMTQLLTPTITVLTTVSREAARVAFDKAQEYMNAQGKSSHPETDNVELVNMSDKMRLNTTQRSHSPTRPDNSRQNSATEMIGEFRRQLSNLNVDTLADQAKNLVNQGQQALQKRASLSPKKPSPPANVVNEEDEEPPAELPYSKKTVGEYTVSETRSSLRRRNSTSPQKE